MALLDLWQANPEVRAKRIDQVIALAGDGRLRDGNETSSEFRALLAAVPSDVLRAYADQCLAAERFDDHGLALQDLVNEAGRRLGFVVEPGLYRGRPGSSGHDGLWRAPGHTIVVEVKTTTAYRIDLDTIAGYRVQLSREGRLDLDEASILLVVGREDTGGVEAQIRGSRYAWDLRMISVDALFKLVAIQERLNDPGTQAKIHDILTPREYTRVDGIVDLVFSTTQDVDWTVPPQPDGEGPANGAERPSPPPAQFNETCIVDRTGWRLVRRSRTTWVAPRGEVGVICLVSREYDTDRRPNYWFSFHPYHADALDRVTEGYVALGCATDARILLVPWAVVRDALPGLWTTQRDSRSYWHLVVDRRRDGFFLRVRSGGSPLDWSRYLFVTSDAAASTTQPTS
jgi:hypothetical protein